MITLNGRDVSTHVRQKLTSDISIWSKTSGRAPGLAVVLIGDDPASHVYVKNKVKSCENVGIQSRRVQLSAGASFGEVKTEIEALNVDNSVDGILVQLPLPKHLNEKKVLELIDPSKDADGLTVHNNGLLYSGEAEILPCTPSGIIEMLKHYNVEMAGKKAVVVGRSHIVGLPMFYLLQKENATVTLCHSKTEDLKSHTSEADIVVVAAGRPEFLGRDAFKKGAVVIDVGIHRKSVEGKTKLVGDVCFPELEGWVRAASPVPRGVGPMTITMLLVNTFKIAQRNPS